MKKLVILAIVLFVLATGISFAEETSGATYTSPNGEINQNFVDYINEQECIDHTHLYEQAEQYDRDNPLGVGADIVVWQNEAKTVGVEVQEKYDFANEENSAFAVVKLNVWDMFKKRE